MATVKNIKYYEKGFKFSLEEPDQNYNQNLIFKKAEELGLDILAKSDSEEDMKQAQSNFSLAAEATKDDFRNTVIHRAIRYEDVTGAYYDETTSFLTVEFDLKRNGETTPFTINITTSSDEVEEAFKHLNLI